MRPYSQPAASTKEAGMKLMPDRRPGFVLEFDIWDLGLEIIVGVLLLAGRVYLRLLCIGIALMNMPTHNEISPTHNEIA